MTGSCGLSNRRLWLNDQLQPTAPDVEPPPGHRDLDPAPRADVAAQLSGDIRTALTSRQPVNRRRSSSSVMPARGTGAAPTPNISSRAPGYATAFTPATHASRLFTGTAW